MKIPNWKAASTLTFRAGKNPKILFTLESALKINEIVRACSKEVGFLGTVEEIEPLVFLIENIETPKQEVNSATCEIDPIGVAEYQDTLRLLDAQDEGKRGDRIRFWGHSHVTMGVNPSGQDESEFKEACAALRSPDAYYIMGIWNKAGDMRLDIKFPNVNLGDDTDGIRFCNVDFEVVLDRAYAQRIKDDVEQSMMANVKEKTFSFPQGVVDTRRTDVESPSSLPRAKAKGETFNKRIHKRFWDHKTQSLVDLGDPFYNADELPDGFYKGWKDDY